MYRGGVTCIMRDSDLILLVTEKAMLPSRTTLHLVFTLFLGSSLLAQSPATASISGTLRTEDGKSVSAVVRLRSRTNPTMRPVAVTPAPTGAFTLTNLPAGNYELCASVSSDPYTDPCVWTPSGTPVTLQPGQTLTGVVLTIKKASTLKVHVNDPGKLIKDSREGAILMGVVAPNGQFFPAMRKNSNSNGNDYEVTVPFDQQFHFSIVPIGLSVADANNQDVGDRQSIPQQHQSNGPTPPVLNFTVKGKK